MSHFNIRNLSEEEYSLWDEFVDKSEYGTIFHKTTWNNSLKPVDNFTNFDVIACFNKDNAILGGAIIPWKRVLHKYKVVIVPYATCFQGILINERNSDYVSKRENYRFEILNEIIGNIEKNYDSITLAFPPDFKDIRALKWQNYDVDVLYTYYGDLTNLEEGALLPDIRRRIKKAEQTDYVIKESKDENHLKIVFDLISKSYTRQNHIFRFSRNDLIRFVTCDELNDNISVFSIWLDEKPVSAIIFLKEGSKAYYWLAGGDHAYFDTGLNQLLLWKVIEKMKNMGVTSMDFVGANTPSISKYKAGYNLDLESYFSIHKDISRSYRFLSQLKNVFK